MPICDIVDQTERPTGHINNVKLPSGRFDACMRGRKANEFNCVMLRALASEAIADSIRPILKTGKPRRKRPLARRVANQRARLIRRMFKWAAGRQLVEASVPANLENFEAIYAGELLEIDGQRITAQDPPPSPVSFQRTIFSGQLKISLAARVLLYRDVTTHPRPVSLKPFRCGPRISIEPGSTWVYRPRWHKNLRRGLPREIQIGPRAQEVLRPWLRPEETEEFVFNPRRTVELMREAARQQRLKHRPKAKGNRKKPTAKPHPAPR